MAITINKAPKDSAPVYNKMQYLLTSTNFAKTDFSYLVDIYINGAGTKAVRLRVPKRPNDDKGLIDIHRVLETTLNSNVGNTLSVAGSNEAPNHALTYIVKFGEEYIDGGTLTQFENLTVDVSREAVNGALEKKEWIAWDVTDYELDGPSKKFLSNAPDNKEVSIDSHGWLYYIEKTALVNFTVKTYNSAGTLIATFEISPTATSGKIQYIASSPASLNKIANGNLIVGAQPIITSSVATYTIVAEDALDAVISETKTYVIREKCKGNVNTLIFLNKIGGFDSFTFYNGDQLSTNIERKFMKVNVDNVVGNDIVDSMQEREKVQFFTKKSDNIKLYSDWITEEEDVWLLELIASSEIYLQDGDDLIAISHILTSNHRKRQHKSDKLFTLEVDLVFGFDNYTQRG